MTTVWQIWYPSVLLGLLNLIAIAVAAPLLDALRLLVRRRPAIPPRLLPTRDDVRGLRSGWTGLLRLMARPSMRTENGGAVARNAPSASLAASLAVLPLLPGMAVLPGLGWVADLPTVLVLLAMGRGAAVIGALEAGSVAQVLRAYVALLAMARGALGLLPAMLAVFVVTGGLGQAHVIGMLRTGAPARDEVAALLGGAVVAALLAADVAMPDEIWSGADLATCRYAAMLRGAAWIELASALLLPGWLAQGREDAAGWALAALGWSARLFAGATLLGAGQRIVARLDLRRTMLGTSILLSVLAVVAGGPTMAAGTE